MSQSKVQDAASLAVMKMAINTGEETSSKVTEMLKSTALDTNLGNHLDRKV